MKSSTPTILYILYFCKLGLIMPQNVTFSNDFQTTSSSEKTTEKLKSTTSMMSVSQDNSTMNNGQSTLSGKTKSEEGTTKEIKPTISRMTFVQDNATSNNAQSTASRTTISGDGTSEEPKLTTSSIKPEIVTVLSRQEISTDSLNKTTVNDVHSTTLNSGIEMTTDKSTSNKHNLKLTFVNESLPWIRATQHCRENGLIMASNVTEIQNWLEENGIDDNLWLGKYEEYTAWAYIKGCYSVFIDQSSKHSYILDNDRFICQKICKNQTYFGVKNHACICLQDVSKFSRCKCNVPSCVTIWKNVSDVVSLGSCSGKTDCKCIAAVECKPNLLMMSKTNCSQNYKGICDDGSNLKYAGENQTGAEKLCHEKGSFLKWYTNKDCKISLGPQRLTSGKRERLLHFELHKYDEVSKQRLLNCGAINQSAVETHGKQICIENKRKFLCREENGDDVVEPATIHIPENASSGVGAAIGSVIAGIIVIVVIVVSVVYIKRRIMQKDKQSNLTLYDQEIPVSIQSAAVSNSTHNLQNPMSEIIRADRISSDRTTFTVPNADRNMPSNYSLAKPIESNFDTANYSFAKPIETEGDYVYNSDYDHLNSPLKQNVDSDYSLSGQTMITHSDKVGTYDRLKSFERNTDLSSDSNSNYDHLPTNAGSDPTYDVSGKVIHEDSDKYDHLPLNFKHTTADDYQSTNDTLAGDTTDNYDHFVLKQSEAI